MPWAITSALPAACWSLVTFVWIVGALYNSRNAPQVERRSRLGAIPIAFVIVAVLTLAPLDWRRLYFVSRWVEAIGAAILVASTAFAIWSRVQLGAMWSVSLIAREDHELRTEGPYAVTRHPIYTGLIGMLLGTALVTGQGRWVLVLIAGILVLLTKALKEEELMSSVFGDRYTTYRHRVPRIVPWQFLRPGVRRSD
jgi:protein-S-isoprenylcysteine O-methyltransferase Ste14